MRIYIPSCPGGIAATMQLAWRTYDKTIVVWPSFKMMIGRKKERKSDTRYKTGDQHGPNKLLRKF